MNRNLFVDKIVSQAKLNDLNKKNKADTYEKEKEQEKKERLDEYLKPARNYDGGYPNLD